MGDYKKMYVQTTILEFSDASKKLVPGPVMEQFIAARQLASGLVSVQYTEEETKQQYVVSWNTHEDYINFITTNAELFGRALAEREVTYNANNIKVTTTGTEI